MGITCPQCSALYTPPDGWRARERTAFRVYHYKPLLGFLFPVYLSFQWHSMRYHAGCLKQFSFEFFAVLTAREAYALTMLTQCYSTERELREKYEREQYMREGVCERERGSRGSNKQGQNSGFHFMIDAQKFRSAGWCISSSKYNKRAPESRERESRGRERERECIWESQPRSLTSLSPSALRILRARWSIVDDRLLVADIDYHQYVNSRRCDKLYSVAWIGAKMAHWTFR